MCKVLVVLDNDDAGHSEGRKAIERRLINEKCIKYIGGPGSREAELEDIIRPNFYKDLYSDDETMPLYDIFIKERLHVVESIVTAVEQMLE